MHICAGARPGSLQPASVSHPQLKLPSPSAATAAAAAATELSRGYAAAVGSHMLGHGYGSKKSTSPGPITRTKGSERRAQAHIDDVHRGGPEVLAAPELAGRGLLLVWPYEGEEEREHCRGRGKGGSG